MIRHWQAYRELHKAVGPSFHVWMQDGTFAVSAAVRKDGRILTVRRWSRKDPWYPYAQQDPE